MPNKLVKQVVIKENEFSTDDEPPLLIHDLVEKRRFIPHYLSTGDGQPANSILPGLKSLEFKNQFFSEASLSDWCDWKWQLRNSIRTVGRLKNFLNVETSDIYPGIRNRQTIPIRITPYYLSLIDRGNPFHAIGRTVIPMINEYFTTSEETSDPLCENGDSPLPNLVHRYPDRVLLLATGVCSSYCRYCTRSRLISDKNKSSFAGTSLEPAFEYIRNNPEIRDVVVSGGDPLTLSDARIERILFRLRSIPHVEIIRIGSKVPVVLPQRITTSLTNILKKYHPLWMSIHFTHPEELSPEVMQACGRLADAGIPLGSQTVLLKNVNDSMETMRELYHGLLKIRVRPYYLYQCDPVPGTSHFRTPVEKGLEIIRGLRGHTSGYAVPHFVIDAPGGGGKIPLLPEYYIGRQGDYVLLKNFEGKTFMYPDTAN